MGNTEKTILALGRTAEVLTWGNQQVLKLFYAWIPANWVEHEAAAARLVSLTGLPTPKLLGEQTLDGRRGLVYERVTGPSLLSLVVNHPWNCTRYARQFAGLHAAIHRQHGEGLPSFKANLARTIRNLEGLPSDLLKTALERLDRLPEGETLCHCDFHPDQVLMTSNGLVVLDWMTACTSQPAADVARTEVIINFSPLPQVAWPVKQLAGLLRKVFFRTYLKRYGELNPAVTATEVEEWLPIVALARLAEKIPGEKSQLEAFIRKAFT